MLNLQELSKLEVVELYHELEPLYKLYVEQIKNELLESGEKGRDYDLPNGGKVIFKKKEEYSRTSIDTKVVKERFPNWLELGLGKTTTIPASVSVEFL